MGCFGVTSHGIGIDNVLGAPLTVAAPLTLAAPSVSSWAARPEEPLPWVVP